MSRDYDDWKLDDNTDGEKIFCNCYECSGEIYEGEDYIELNNGVKLHTEGECFERYTEDYFNPKNRVAGEEWWYLLLS